MTRIWKGWNVLRFLRLFAGLAILVQGVYLMEWFLIIAGTLFAGMAVFNAGCCATYGCGYNKTAGKNSMRETTYEEVV